MGDSPKIVQKRLRQVALDRAVPFLQQGDDVVLDVLFNKPASREKITTIARKTGALTMGLCVKTPKKIALARAAEMDSRGWPKAPVKTSNRMMKRIVWPLTDEGIDYLCRIDGGVDVDGVLDQFDEAIERFGLEVRYEDEPRP